MAWHAVTLASILAMRSWISLERGDRLAKLQALLRVFQRGFIGAHLQSRGHPADAGPGLAQHVCGVTERLGVLQAVGFRNAAVLHA